MSRFEPGPGQHAAQCGPERGMLICYCDCGLCMDEQGRCICEGCGAWHSHGQKEVKSRGADGPGNARETKPSG